MCHSTGIKYPVGIQTFEKIINEGYVYVDKTELIYNLVNTYDYIFLSRPRRFGKSLLISTLEAFFQGRKELFKDLAIEHLEKDWVEYPVLRIDMASDSYESIDKFNRVISYYLSGWERQYGVETAEEDSIAIRFRKVIQTAYEQTGRKVVILVDEYDKPIIDALHEPELQKALRTRMQGFYSVLKASDQYIKFAMLTGVGKFTHLSIFSGLNNLTDISMDFPYNSICGISEREMHRYFEESIKEYAASNGITEENAWEDFKRQYDGYHFSLHGEDMYNPFSVLNAFAKKRISNYWFRTGTPSFLVKLLNRNRVPLVNLDSPMRSENQLSDINDLSRDVVPLLFQAGYLTIKDWDERRQKYILNFPNREVYSGFWESLVDAYFPMTATSTGFDLFSLVDALVSGEIDRFMESVGSLIASATSGHIPDKEEHFQNILSIICRMLGLETHTEIHMARGRCDMTVFLSNYIYIFEFKINSSPEEALAQIKEKRYAAPYQSDKRKKILIGANFSTSTRTLRGWIAAES